MTKEAAENNAQLLQRYNFDLTALLNDFQDTTLGYGLEFRPMTQLRTILGEHSNFGELETILTHGMTYRFTEEISDEKCVAKLEAINIRGNHKSAESCPEHVSKALAKDIHPWFFDAPPGRNHDKTAWGPSPTTWDGGATYLD
jgi:hypothetical protein